jgi:hypothetical protein
MDPLKERRNLASFCQNRYDYKLLNAILTSKLLRPTLRRCPNRDFACRSRHCKPSKATRCGMPQILLK